MDRFRIRTGEILGIVVPGMLLLGDLALAFTRHGCLSVLERIAGGQHSLGDQAVFVFFLFVASYVTGFALRLISPHPADWLSGRLRFQFRRLARRPTRFLNERFPYWRMFKFYCDDTRYPASWQTVYWQLLRPHFEELANLQTRQASTPNQDEPHPRNWNAEADRAALDLFNSYKLLVIARSSALGDEVSFAEGVSRLVFGLVYASGIGLAAGGLAWLCRSGPCEVPGLGPALFLTVNLALFIVFLLGCRHVRAREAFVVYHAYAVVSRDAAK